MDYDHTQHGPWGTVLGGLGICCAAFAYARWGYPEALVLMALTVIFVFAGLTVGSLNVRDEQDRLAIRFGPLPLIRWRIPYARIEDAEPGRSRLIDGWGLHWVPGRGWTLNLWGFDCVELSLAGGKRMRIGTDEPAALTEFLRARIGAH